MKAVEFIKWVYKYQNTILLTHIFVREKWRQFLQKYTFAPHMHRIYSLNDLSFNLLKL